MPFRAYMLKVRGYSTAGPEQVRRMRIEWRPAYRAYLATFTPALLYNVGGFCLQCGNGAAGG